MNFFKRLFAKKVYVYKEHTSYTEGVPWISHYEAYRFFTFEGDEYWQEALPIGHEGTNMWMKMNPEQIRIVKSMMKYKAGLSKYVIKRNNVDAPGDE